jgi:hypothetical protein
MLEHQTERAVRLLVARKHHHPACLPVDSMHGVKPFPAQVRAQHLVQRSAFAAAKRNHRDPGGLVHHRDLLVEVKDVQK